MTLEVESPWDYEHVRDITGGVNVSLAAQQIEKSEFVTLDNLVYREGKLEIDTGYVTFQETVRGTPRGTFQFFKKDNSSELMLFTDATAYSETNNTWFYIHDGDAGLSTTLSTEAFATDTDIDVVDDSAFSDGDFIGITLDDGTQHKTTVNGAPVGNNIVFDDALPSGAAIGKPVVKAVDLSGAATNQISVATLAAFDYLVFTNGLDNVKYYDGSEMQDIPNTPANTKCTSVAVFENYLLLIATQEGGTDYPQRVRWSAQGDITSASAWPSANTNDLYDAEDFNVVGVPLGPYMMIYRERSIIRMEFVGAADKTFNWDPMITGEGVLSVDSVIDDGSEHLFVGLKNIYRYQGGFDLDPIGDDVKDQLFGINGEMNPSHRNKVICLHIEETDELWIVYSLSADTYPTKIAKLNLAYDAWTFRILPIAVSGHGFASTDDTLKWNELIGSWAAQTWKWGGVSAEANSPITHLCSATGSNQVYSYDYAATTDNGTAISWTIKTKEFFQPQHNVRHDRLDMKAAGGTILVEYSTDGGENWSVLKNPTLDTVCKIRKLWKQFVGERIQYMMTGTGPGFSLEWFGFRHRPESIN